MAPQTNTGGDFSHNEDYATIQQAVVPCPGFRIIPLPDAAYQGATNLIDISNIPEFDTVDSINDDSQTVIFDSPEQRLQVPSSWSTWSSPPFSENDMPPILSSLGATTLILNLSTPSSVFRFELEPNPFGLFEVTVEFFSGGIPIGSITQEVEGAAGARLFAAEFDPSCGLIDQVIISSSVDFAIANIRYAVAFPGDLVRCPSLILVLCQHGRHGTTVHYPDPITSSKVTCDCSPPSGTFFPLGTTTVNTTVFTPFGDLLDACTILVKVIDSKKSFIDRLCHLQTGALVALGLRKTRSPILINFIRCTNKHIIGISEGGIVTIDLDNILSIAYF
ncbi:hypothetical protein GCM10011391_06750 [Pullulanibacillus camelliae]|uniref:Uncharacterized protein n=1 Tax=Pullulanibacillus camelliae TaxID=1707096 RepID=A0A8J2VM97_9BACL|nr:hypothetical protein [Pullulanibacillus camelliae]GGE30788.1 hypothetical protein GCM10011391_06750 [Pullulanibacillus camelliae]